jgi:hypothetical protein
LQMLGGTTANTAVTLRLLRNGQVLASRSTTSGSSGSYSFSFSNSISPCSATNFNSLLQPGDVVEVSAHGSTVSTVVANLSAWVDPATNTVAGKTDSGRSTLVALYAYNDPCMSASLYQQTLPTDTNGNFSADFTGQVDFDGRAYAYIYALDANGNSTVASFNAYRITAYFNASSFSGYLKPNVDFIVTLSRSNTIVSTSNGRSSAAGYYSGNLSEPIQPGDVVSVTGGGATTLQLTAANLEVTLDQINDQISGTTAAGRLVKANIYRNTGSPATTCSSANECKSSLGSQSGTFAWSSSLNLKRGDYAYFTVYDASGNYQTTFQRYVPFLKVQLDSTSVSGAWGKPNVNHWGQFFQIDKSQSCLSSRGGGP